VFLQCFTDADYQFAKDVGPPLIPLKLGPADWVDAARFTPNLTDAKPYDLVMVANWALHKRHGQLFRAIREIDRQSIRVLLIGFPWAGRTADDIRTEARDILNGCAHVEIIEQVPQHQLAGYLSQCKVFVFLSRKEGDNKALVEAMFANVPAIVYDKTIGGATSRINPATGMLSSDQQLPKAIVHMLANYRTFSPRAWALEHTGSAIATRILNSTIKEAIRAAGGQYVQAIVEKTNSPNLTYRDERCRALFHADYEFVLACRRAQNP
jgi:glycosyltransferase involved in cell wall biosynthesis